jgi:RNA polymerase sigma-70 factor (ECF subfamily)
MLNMLIARKRPLSAEKLGRLADEELMKRVQAADADAFAVLYDRHSSAAYSLAYRILGSATSAEDVLQEVFLTVWRSAVRFDEQKGSCRGWVLTITHHRSIDVIRRVTRHQERWLDEAMHEQVPSGEAGPASLAEDHEQHDRLTGALSTLPDEQRQVIELAYFGGYTHSEISDMLELAPGTVKGRLRLGLDKLREVNLHV